VTTSLHSDGVTSQQGEKAGSAGIERYRSIIDVYVLLPRADGMILLLERAGTGYADGQLCPLVSTGVRAGSLVPTW
jgi:hypothetical protein